MTTTRALHLGGTIRATAPEATLARARTTFRAIGLSRLGNVTGLDHVGVPTWIAVRPLARSLTVSQGKGLTHALAQASAVMESIELHHAEHFVPAGPLISMRDAITDPRCACPLFLPIRPRSELREHSRAEWIAGTDLVSGEERWVPRDCVDLDSGSRPDDTRLFVSSSNGLASGNTKDEATLHALCEVIERDQVSLWLARREFDRTAPASRLRLDDVHDADCCGLIDKCAAAGVGLAVWSVSETMQVPCFLCTAFDVAGRTFFPQWATGFGCHPYRGIALARSITEALQSRLTCIAGGRDDLTWSQYRDLIGSDTPAGVRWLSRVDSEVADVRLQDIPQAPPSLGIEAMLDWILAALAAESLNQAIVVDLTQGDLGIPVVHATVPGLEAQFGKPEYSPGLRMQRFLARHRTS